MRNVLCSSVSPPHPGSCTSCNSKGRKWDDCVKLLICSSRNLKILQFTSLHHRTRTQYVYFWSTTKKNLPILNKVSWLSLSLRTLNRIHSATKLPVRSQGPPFQSPNRSKNLQDNLPTTTNAGRKLLEN